MSTKTLIFVGLALVAALGVVVYILPFEQLPQPVACTMEAKLCPDGSAVGRVGPNCEFAACPEATSTGGTSTGGGGGGNGILPYRSGIRGTVMLGPTCPVMRDPPDPQCADRPYQTTVVAYRVSDPGYAVETMQSSADGTFEMSLPPSEYVIKAGGEKMLPRCAPASVTVGPDAYTSVTISCDSGIR